MFNTDSNQQYLNPNNVMAHSKTSKKRSGNFMMTGKIQRIKSSHIQNRKHRMNNFMSGGTAAYMNIGGDNNTMNVKTRLSVNEKSMLNRTRDKTPKID